jgi:hypothetical protein
VDLGLKEGKMNKIIVPETFMLLFPRGVLLETLKKAAYAEVFETKRLARARVALPAEIEADLPSLSKTLFLLGDPSETVTADGRQTLSYRYRMTHIRRFVPIVAQLSFDAQGLLRRVRVRWDTSTVEAEYLRN